MLARLPDTGMQGITGMAALLHYTGSAASGQELTLARSPDQPLGGQLYFSSCHEEAHCCDVDKRPYTLRPNPFLLICQHS